MAEFKISRLRYTWREDWATSTPYIKDDIVKYGGSVWVCIRQHEASEFAADQIFTYPEATEQSPAWIKMADGYAYRSTWETDTLYNPGDIISYGGELYLCAVSHTSQPTFEENIADWTLYGSYSTWLDAWQPNTRYGIGDLVQYGGIVYRCRAGHTSSTTSSGLEVNQSQWTILHSNVEYKGEWVNGTRYKPNDLVKYGGTVFRCTIGHTASGFVSGNFAVEFYGFNFVGDWNNTTIYSIGDVVRHGGYNYRSNSNNSAKNPGDSIYQTLGTPDWTQISKGHNLRGEWSRTETYKSGDVVQRGGYIYRAILDTTDDGSSLDYLDSGNWELVSVGQHWRDVWALDVEYAIGDLATFEGTTYSCNLSHTASSQNYPGDNGSGYSYWDIVLLAGPNAGMTARGDMLTFDLSRKLAGDGSSFNETAVNIGNENQLLSIDGNDSVDYKTWGNTDFLVYVNANNGVDDNLDSDRGFNYFKPWRTIRYACEQIEEQGLNVGNNVTVRVWTGYYEEVLPIIVPANTAIVGDELRSVTVVPNGPIAALADDANKSIAALQRINALVENILKGLPVVKTVGNELDAVVVTSTETINVPYVPARFDNFGVEIYQYSYQSEVPLVVADETIALVQSLILTATGYIDYHLNSAGTEPVLTGSNTASDTATNLNAVAILEANKNFLAAEASAYTTLTSPGYEFNPVACQRDARRFIDAFKYDIIYTGNYKTLLAARYYRNAVLGSITEDMFYVRNSTGIRNLSLKGLIGTLTPPLTYELYRRPTGGAFVSLDPGWGPDDERVWITTRSCYVQNCTTFGDASVGQKIDGSLHNGGNKSIVSNDFTQIISDGIGAWVLNGGRAELVSVFTYYAQIGMFAEDGGIIRATNGNSSYGDFGAIADGNDPAEVPQYGYVNTQTGEAIIASAFAGEVNDEILRLEFTNAGQNYTTANYSFVGSGTGANVTHDEVRDNAVFDIHIISPADSGNIGGADYSLYGNNAQTGNLLGVTLASNNENTEAELLGLRVVLTSGTGTGQYGYVHAYNPLTKVCTVYRESDDLPGWDHVEPGYPLATILTTSTVYRFEPRPIFSHPGYSSSTVGLSESLSWANIVYGETTETYSNVQGTAGTGETLNVVPVAATWNITKNARKYTVTLASGGSGYLDEQLIIIDGSLVGGISGEHDIIITVKSVSNDSTNSILTFEYTGIARSGRFVITPSTGSVASVSYDGASWNSVNLPTAGNWNCLTSGNNKFVAVSNSTANALTSPNGVTWTASTMPAAHAWNAVTYGNGVFLAVAGDANAAAYSINDGANWTATTLASGDGSTINEYVDAAYGKNKYVALANSNNSVSVGTYNSIANTWAWEHVIMDVIDDSTQKNWTSIAYGNNRFVAISSEGSVGYSFEPGSAWYGARLPVVTNMSWRSISYGQGVFTAVGQISTPVVDAEPTLTPTTVSATSYDGIVWTVRTLANELNWKASAFGNPDISLGDSTLTNSSPMWVAISDDVTSVANRIVTGARTIGRCIVEGGLIKSIRIWEPGSGYVTAPTLTVVDPKSTNAVNVVNRIADGVLGQPSWVNRGIGYKTSSTVVNITGDGFADVLPVGKYVTLSGLVTLPSPGAQFRFGGSQFAYTVVQITRDSTESDGTQTAIFQISPYITIDDDITNNMQVEIREKYAQVRITGHDFLDVGTGNFLQTNYPVLYSTGDYTGAPENEVVEENGGRVFYTSTDQSGNFRTGELFAVEQATGIVTISADFFDLQGLQELALGGVRLGGSAAVIREFSTDPLFTADSNNIVPTQRAIKAYLASRLNVGGADLLTASFIAGTIKVGPTLIDNVAGLDIDVVVRADFKGNGASISGSILGQSMFFRSFKDDGQQ